MPRFARGVTLPAEQRLIVKGKSADGKVRAHSVTVSLPNGSTCEVEYRRHGPTAHEFRFLSPIHHAFWSNDFQDGGIPAVETEARKCGLSAFCFAQEREQQAMRRATRDLGAPNPGEPQMNNAAARQAGGKYAACLKGSTTNLLRLGSLHDHWEPVKQEVEQGRYATIRMSDGQQIVIGICNRATRRWQEPCFVVQPQPSVQEPEPPKRRRRSSKLA